MSSLSPTTAAAAPADSLLDRAAPDDVPSTSGPAPRDPDCPASMPNDLELAEKESDRKEKDKERKRQKRATETVQDSQDRLQKDSEYKRRRKAEETEEEKRERLDRRAEKQRQNRASKSETDVQNRRNDDAEKKRRSRAEESEGERNARKAQDAERRRLALLQETEEEENTRKAKDSQKKRDDRQNETEEEKNNRLMSVSQRRLARIQEEEAEETKKRQERRKARRIILDALKSKADSDRILQNSEEKLHYLGPMSKECEHCHALFFESEIQGKKPSAINFCCSSGTIQLEEHFSNFPPQLQELFEGSEDPAQQERNELSKNFRENIRQFNNSFATASFGARIDSTPILGNGPFTMKVQGQVYHRAGPLHPEKGSRPSYGQLFVLDSSEAAQERMNVPANSKCNVTIMEELSNLLSAINIFSQSYKMMHEVEKQEELDALLAGRNPKPVQMIFDASRPNLDLRRYNLPTSNEVAIVYVQEDGMIPSRSIAAHSRDGRGWINIFDTDPIVDPMTYPLFFPNGELGWHDGMTRIGSNRKSTRIAQQPFYRYLTMIRKNRFNPIHFGANLTQQFLCDSWCKTEQNRLKFHRDNQKQIRSEEYKELRDYVNNGDGVTPGRRVILPSSFRGSPRFMVQEYQDVMSMVTKCGKPDFFVTATCNPKWREITENLNPGQKASDRPDLIARVFKEKVGYILHLLLKMHLFGEVAAHVMVYEWQKRGLPHIHLLLTMKEGHKPKNKDDIDRLISAEIPDLILEPRLHEIVTRQMIHRPCGLDNPKSPCMKNDVCSKRFPKPFRDETKWEQNGYPEYRRRDDGRSVKCGGCEMTNQRVVPYNRDLLLMLDAHINVEACGMLEVVKYLHKYVFKGSDRASIRIRREQDDGDEINEIDQYLDCRYICAPEACHHLFGYPTHIKSHVVYRLPIHLPDCQSVIFVPGNEKNAVANSERKGTKLTEFFRLNAEFKEKEEQGEDLSGKEDPRKCPYVDFPTKFTWVEKEGKWKERARGGEKTIGRMYAVSPSDPERFALRLLLLATTGATSFEDLRTIPDDNGNEIVHPTFLLAARSLGLLKDDAEYQKALEECESYQMPAEMRSTFSSILVFNEIGDPQLLWDQFKKGMSEDFIHLGCNEEEAEALAYDQIREKMARFSKSIEAFISPPTYTINSPFTPQMDFDEIGEEGARLYATLTLEQKNACDDILAALDDPSLPRLFYLDGCGGSGKTYLYNVIWKILMGRRIQMSCSAWTGIASTLLPDGRTIASMYKMDINKDCRASLLKLNSKEAAALRETSVFVADEASMISKDAVETMDQVLKDVMENDLPFGGKIFILGGDFRQVLPVVRRGSRSDQVDGCLKMSSLWSQFKLIRLTANMRVTSGDKEWIDFLLRVGDGSANDFTNRIQLDPDVYTNGDLIEEVFGSTIDQLTDLSESAILAPKNVDVDKMNEEVHNRMRGSEKIFYSRDEVVDDSNTKVVTTEFLNSINTSSLPPHRLKLKVGSIVMLLRNLDVASGLCNGTRLTVLELGRRMLKCKYSTGSRIGKTVLIPRIDCYDDNNLAFKLRRTQFPVRLAFALSINKSQGQSFSRIGLWLPEDVFTHGQLYVALSRVRSKEGLFVKTENSNLLNVVFTEVL